MAFQRLIREVMSFILPGELERRRLASPVRSENMRRRLNGNSCYSTSTAGTIDRRTLSCSGPQDSSRAPTNMTDFSPHYLQIGSALRPHYPVCRLPAHLVFGRSQKRSSDPRYLQFDAAQPFSGAGFRSTSLSLFLSMSLSLSLSMSPVAARRGGTRPTPSI